MSRKKRFQIWSFWMNYFCQRGDINGEQLYVVPCRKNTGPASPLGGSTSGHAPGKSSWPYESGRRRNQPHGPPVVPLSRKSPSPHPLPESCWRRWRRPRWPRSPAFAESPWSSWRWRPSVSATSDSRAPPHTQDTPPETDTSHVPTNIWFFERQKCPSFQINGYESAMKVQLLWQRRRKIEFNETKWVPLENLK